MTKRELMNRIKLLDRTIKQESTTLNKSAEAITEQEIKEVEKSIEGIIKGSHVLGLAGKICPRCGGTGRTD